VNGATDPATVPREQERVTPTPNRATVSTPPSYHSASNTAHSKQTISPHGIHSPSSSLSNSLETAAGQSSPTTMSGPTRLKQCIPIAVIASTEGMNQGKDSPPISSLANSRDFEKEKEKGKSELLVEREKDEARKSSGGGKKLTAPEKPTVPLAEKPTGPSSPPLLPLLEKALPPPLRKLSASTESKNSPSYVCFFYFILFYFYYYFLFLIYFSCEVAIKIHFILI
jgi:hypothetical protein